MKKTISLVLCVTMLMLSVANCLPAFAIQQDSEVFSENLTNTAETVTEEESQLLADSVTVTFIGEGLVSVPDPITVASGYYVDLSDYTSDYYKVTPKDSSMRFNGWSTTGKAEDIVYGIEVNESVNLYAVVNHDINLSIHTSGWTLANDTLAIVPGGVRFTHNRRAGNSQYVYTFSEGVPISDYKQVVYYYLDDYVMYGTNRNTSPSNEKFSNASAAGPFGFTSTKVSNGSVNVPKPQQVYGSNEMLYAKFVANACSYAPWRNGGKLKTMTVSPLGSGFYDSMLAYIKFVPYDIYENDTIEIVGVEKPETGKFPTPQTKISSDICEIENYTWSPAIAEDERFVGGETYTLTLEISPLDKEHKFKSDVAAKVSGLDADIVVDKETGKATVTVEFPATISYKDLEFDLSTLPDEITVTNAEPFQFEINVDTEKTDADADTSVTWSVIGENASFAKITKDGLFTAEVPGNYTIQAASNYRFDKVAEKTINVKFAESLEMVTINFVGDVNNLPDAITRIKGSTINVANYYDCTSAIPGKRFNGWTATGDFKDVKDEVLVTGDVTFTAVVNYDFNFATKENQDGWGYNDPITYENGYLVTPDGTVMTSDTQLYSPRLDLPAAKVEKVQLYINPHVTIGGRETEITEDFEIQTFFYKTSDGIFRPISGVKPSGKAADGSMIFEFDVCKDIWWAGTIPQFRFDLATGDTGYKLRYINIIEREAFDEKELNIIGVDTPKTGATVSYNAEITSENFTINSVKWLPEPASYEQDGQTYTIYDEKTEYTIEIQVSPVAGSTKRFADDTTATINGVPADIIINEQGIAVITYKYPVTEAYEVFDLSIAGPTEITKASRATRYSAVFTGGSPSNTSVIWSVSDTSVAEIDEGGKLIPLSDGTVTVKVVSKYNPLKFAELEVTILNQGEEITITYDDGTNVEDIEMPAPETGNGTFILSTQVPVREGYQFLGWSTDDEKLDTVTTYAPEKSAKVYAVWQKIGRAWDFNNSLDGFEGYPAVANEEYLSVVTNSGDWQMYKDLNGNNIDAATEKKIQIKFSIDEGLQDQAIIFYQGTETAAEFQPENSVYSPGNKVELYIGQGLDNWMIADFDMASNPSWKGNITNLRFDVLNKSPEGTNVRIDYIYTIIPERTVTFNANGTGVTNMPANTTKDVGETLNITQVPKRAGYQFIGWAKSANPADGEKVKSTWTITDNTTLYAIWNKIYVPESDLTKVKLYADEEANNQTVLVLTQKDTTVYLEFIDENGVPTSDTYQAKANGQGYARFYLDELGASSSQTASLFALSAGGGSSRNNEHNIHVWTVGTEIKHASVLSKSIADDIAETVPDEKVEISTQVGGGGGGGGGGSSHEMPKYDMSVSDTTTDGKIKPDEVNAAAGVEQTTTKTDPADKAETIDELMAASGPIVVNFDKSYQNDFFHTIRRFINDGRYDSMAMYINLGLSSSGRAPALYTEEFKMDTSGHNYVVMKVRNTGYSSNKVTMNFKKVGGSFEVENEITLENENNNQFSMFVWDMSEVEDWNGYIEGLYFAFGEDKDARTEVDWILFTDEKPESIDQIQGAYEYFPLVNRGEFPFSDVLSTDWFYSDVAQAYQLNFVNGTSKTTYSPHGLVTIAETITLAVRLSSMYNGLPVPQPATEGDWYAPFVDAAVEAKLIRKDQFKNYNAPASRREVVQIIGNIFREEYLPAINMFMEVPDLKTSESIYSTVLAFYNAGILVGDSAHNFNADTNINRSEIAAIINRFANVENRVRVITQAEIEAGRRWFYSESFVGAGTQFCTDALVLKDGYATAWSETDDPAVYFGVSIPAFEGGEVTRIVIGLKWDQSVLPSISKNDLYYTTASDASWSGDRRIDGHPGTADENGIVPFSFYTSDVKLFDDMITGLRFDPFSAPGVEFSVAYVMIE